MNDPSLFVFGQGGRPEQMAAEAAHALRGLRHAGRISPLDPAPNDAVTVIAESGTAAALRRVRLSYATDVEDPCSGIMVNAARVDSVWDPLAWCFVDRWEAVIPPQPDGTAVRYMLRGEAADGRTVEADAETGRPNLYGYTVDRLMPPEWIRDAVIYQIFVDRFSDPFGAAGRPARGGEIYGGTLDGIRARLDYLTALGVDTLWLTPIFPSETHHGYDALDYESVATRLGGDDALRRLVAAAHESGMRILLDLAANHCSWHHPWFLEAQRDAADAHRDWFRWIDWPDHYHSFMDSTPYLPQLNTWNPAVVRYVTDVAAHYLCDVGVDGFRLDHAHGPPLSFWSDFRTGTRRAKSDSYTLGEVTLAPPGVRTYEGRLDGCLDFPVLAALRGFFLHRTFDAAALHAFLEANDRYYDPAFTRPSFLDNHDMNRFLWAADGDKRLLKLAAACQFALPQPPIVYYGTEIGLSQTEDTATGGFEAARLPMPWHDQDEELLAYYRALIRARRDHHALRRGGRSLVAADGDLYVFLCHRADDRVLVALNRSEERREVAAPVAGEDILTGDWIEGALTLEPLGAALVAVTDRDEVGRQR